MNFFEYFGISLDGGTGWLEALYVVALIAPVAGVVCRHLRLSNNRR